MMCVLCRTMAVGHPLDRGVRGPPRSIPKRPRLEVSLEDRLQNELQRSLDHAIADGGNGEGASCRPPSESPAAGSAAADSREPVRAGVAQETRPRRCLDGVERHPVDYPGHHRSPLAML